MFVRRFVTPLLLALVLVANGASAAPIAFDLQTQPLGDALKKFAWTAATTLSVESALVAGKVAPTVKGMLEPAEALRQLLNGSGLEADPGPSGGFVVRRAVPAREPESVMPEVRVTDTATVAGAGMTGEVPSPYAGGQVARGGSIGMLGNFDVMDAPFSTASYTARTISDQHARYVSDVLVNDPAVNLPEPTDGSYDNFVIRGFPVTASAFSLNGLYGVLPWNNLSTEFVERVELIKGPTTMVGGVSPFDAVGGAINVVPKRASDAPLTELTASMLTNGQAGLHADIGRRFGADNRFGFRINTSYRDGDTAFDSQSDRLGQIALALDYRGDALRLSADMGYQDQSTEGATFALPISSGFDVPAPLKDGSNPFPSWAFANSRDSYIALAGEFDISRTLTAFAALGARDDKVEILNPWTNIDASNGDTTVFPYHETYFSKTRFSSQAGVRGQFETGPVIHQAVLSASLLEFEVGWLDTFFGPVAGYPSNLHSPAGIPEPDLTGVSYDTPKARSYRLSGIALADTLSMADDRLQLILGLRRQTIRNDNFDTVTGARDSSYDQSKVTPALGIVFKPRKNVSVYGNYMEGLTQGPVPPSTASNSNQVFLPSVTKQYEAGVKVDWGRMLTTLSAFQITQPSGLTDPGTNVFSVLGEQRNRGLELGIFGEVVRGVRVMGGASYVDAVLTKTEDSNDPDGTGDLDGKQAVGVPKFKLTLGTEWDVPAFAGFSLIARAIHTGAQSVDAENVQRLPAWTRWDAGARYAFRGLGMPMIVRLNVLNLLGADYWSSSTGSALSLGTPRTVSLSVTTRF